MSDGIEDHINHTEYTARPLSPTWLESKNKWPERLESELQSLMLEHNLFTLSKRKDDSVRKFKTIVEALQQHFDSTRWAYDADRYTRLLEGKIQNKVNRTRQALVTRGVIVQRNGGYDIRSEEEEIADDTSYQLRHYLQSLSPKEQRSALEVVMDLVDQETLMKTVARWFVKRSPDSAILLDGRLPNRLDD